MLTKWIMKEIGRILLALVFGLAPLLTGCAGEKLSDQRRAQHLGAFDQVWSTVEANHWDRELVETEWTEARGELRPRLEAAETEAEADAVTNQLIASLGQSHFGVIPKTVYDQVDSESGEGQPGITARLRGGEGLIVRVQPGSPADDAGVRPGDVLLQVDDRDIAESIAAVEAAAQHGVNRAETIFAQGSAAWMSGEVGSTRVYVIRTPSGEVRELELELIEPEGEQFRFGNLPAQRVAFRSETIESGIGYFYLGGFFGPQKVMPAFQEFIESHTEAPGLVIDLRGNPGGIMPMSTGMGGFLIEGKGEKLGTLTTRDSTLKMVINPRRGAFTGPVAVLIDELSASNSEILAGGLQGLGRARVFGARTAGLVLPARVETLPTGDGFIYAFADYENVSGERLEGAGVEPDEPVELTPEAYADSSDPVLDAAVAWIQGQG